MPTAGADEVRTDAIIAPLPEPTNRRIHSADEIIGRMQTRLVTQLLSMSTLARLHDTEIKQAADADTYTLAEHVRSLVDGIFTEWREAPKPGEYSNRKPYVNSLRRNLQRITLKELAALINAPPANPFIIFFGGSSGSIPEDARTLVRMHLTELDKQITALLAAPDPKLDDYTRAHLLDSQERIRKVLQAQVVTNSID